MENIRNRVDFNLVHTKKRLQKLASKPSFDTSTIFNKHLVGVKNKKVKLLFDKPIYTGMVILDLSKFFMYEFHYGFVKKEYGENAKLLMTDTDSLFFRYDKNITYITTLLENCISYVLQLINFFIGLKWMTFTQKWISI